MMMKRFLKGGKALFMAAAATALLGLIGCSSPEGGETKEPSLVSISAETDKTVYIVGEDLEIDTITVVGTYSDGTTKTLPISAEHIAGYDKNSPGEQTLTITVEGKSTTLKVSVEEEEWSYTVTFDANYTGGPALQTVTVTNPATSVGTLPEAPSRDDYIFEGWNTEADGSGDEFTETTPVTAAITVYAQWEAVVDAEAPVINVQPQDAHYAFNGAAAALSVEAESPDDGELSYQWHSATAGGTWTAINDATGASYTPPTDQLGDVYYYVQVTNTNDNATGEKTATTNSDSATITVSEVGAHLVVTTWDADNNNLLSNMPEAVDPSKGLREILVIEAATDLTALQWSIGNTDIPAPLGTARSFTIEAAYYAPGNYTLGLYAERDGVPYSTNITFTVDN
jgi:uncharacterized repeat protein (TIGR02543 family)